MRPKQAAIPVALVSLVLAAVALAAPTVYPTGVTISEPGVAAGNVIFGGRDGQVHLIDSGGTDLHTWTFPCTFSYSQKPLAGGSVLSESCGNLVEIDWNSTVMWEFIPPAGATIHHDWERLANGNTLMILRQTVNVPSISSEEIEDDFILEVSPAGSVVWEWHLTDHFGELGFSQDRLDLIDARGGDWSRATSISSIPADSSHTGAFSPGNVILSLEHQNTVLVIDRTTGQIVWVTTDVVIGPHAAQMVPVGLAGGDKLHVFESGFAGDWLPLTALTTELNNVDHSRVLEIDPADTSVDWTYEDTLAGLREGTFSSHTGGAAQRLANGNTLITEASSGRIFEVTAGLQTVWEYVSPHRDVGGSNAVYRAYKVPLGWGGP